MPQAILYDLGRGGDKCLACDGAFYGIALTGVDIPAPEISQLINPSPVDIVSVVYSKTGVHVAAHLNGEYVHLLTTYTASQVMNSLMQFSALRLTVSKRGEIDGVSYTQAMFIYTQGFTTMNLLREVL